MNIESAKRKVSEYVGKKIKVKCYIGRNKYEYFDGKVDKMLPNIFTIITNNGIKSYSYSDILTRNVILNKFWNILLLSNKCSKIKL